MGKFKKIFKKNINRFFGLLMIINGIILSKHIFSSDVVYVETLFVAGLLFFVGLLMLFINPKSN